jgi:hypothetical protein
MDVNYKKILLGMLGEKIIAKHLRDIGCVVDESLDVFDSTKDMVVDGMCVEVKTNAPLFYYDSFSIPQNQYNKIIKSHRVYWLSVPLQTKEDQFSGCIFEMDPNIAKVHQIKFGDGRSVIGVKRQQEGMKIIYKITDIKLLNHLRELSSSYI